MRLWIARSAGLPVREQLRAQLLLAILSGDLRAGERLPSTRELGRRLEIHPNTVSAVYSALERDGWVQLRRGSGVYVRQPKRRTPADPDVALDQLVGDLYRAARERGIPLRRLHDRLRRWLALQPPDHFALIDPDEHLRQILAAEIAAATGFPVVPVAPDDCRAPGALTGAIPVVLASKHGTIRPMLPDHHDCVALQVRSVPRSLAPYLPIRPDALIVVASRWKGFLQWARVLLLSAGVDPDAMELRDAGRPRWHHGVARATVVIADVLTARDVPRGCRMVAFPIVSDASLDELRRYARLAGAP
jgi:GntR family transcriptional regulator